MRCSNALDEIPRSPKVKKKSRQEETEVNRREKQNGREAMEDVADGNGDRNETEEVTMITGTWILGKRSRSSSDLQVNEKSLCVCVCSDSQVLCCIKFKENSQYKKSFCPTCYYGLHGEDRGKSQAGTAGDHHGEVDFSIPP
ncbi:hypothetical protein U1Q18_043646 [Sarracenia purpurea var. burkii]